MSLSIDVFRHPNAGMFYVVFQHDLVYELNSFTKPHADAHCVELGHLWPQGEFGLIGGSFGRQLQWNEITTEARRKIMHILESQNQKTNEHYENSK
jgi:hypothetical protein